MGGNRESCFMLVWFLFIFVALRLMSTAMVICAHTFACNWQQPFLNKSAEGRRMTVEIISWSISTKVWYRAWIELATPGSAVRHASVARHVTDCATRPGVLYAWITVTSFINCLKCCYFEDQWICPDSSRHTSTKWRLSYAICWHIC